MRLFISISNQRTDQGISANLLLNLYRKKISIAVVHFGKLIEEMVLKVFFFNFLNVSDYIDIFTRIVRHVTLFQFLQCF